jgi:hypothetical protein
MSTCGADAIVSAAGEASGRDLPGEACAAPRKIRASRQESITAGQWDLMSVRLVLHVTACTDSRYEFFSSTSKISQTLLASSGTSGSLRI